MLGTNKQSYKINILFKEKNNSTTPTSTSATLAFEPRCNVTSPSLSFLIFWNLYNVLQMWFVALESPHQEFKVPAIKLTLILSNSVIPVTPQCKYFTFDFGSLTLFPLPMSLNWSLT